MINADDYYGKEAYKKAYQYLTEEHPKNPMPVCMVGFILKNTLSDNGGVTRGICQIANDKLIDIVETLIILIKLTNHSDYADQLFRYP